MLRIAFLSAIALFVTAVPAQQEPADPEFLKGEAAFTKRAASELMKFASFARGKKVLTREKEAYDLIVTSYDPDHRSARSKLGYRKVKGVWQEPPPKKRKEWVDKAKDKQRYDVVERWHKTSSALAVLHRDRGLELFGGKDGAQVAAGAQHLRQAILYDPFDAEAHKALGHGQEDGYWGTPEQLAFIKSMGDIETFALVLAKKQYEVEPVEEIPEELQNTGLDFSGARSKHFTVFTRGTQQNADDCVMWAERGLDFLARCVGPKTERRVRRNMRPWGWIGFLWTATEMETFEEVNPGLARGEEGQSFANVIWQKKGKNVEVLLKLTPASMHDYLIAHVFHYGLPGANKQLMEGVQHAATWFLKSTCMTRFATTPKGTVGEAEVALPDSASWWLRKMRDDAIAGVDTSINTVPRVPFWKFRNDARLKSWSFMTWLLARYPDHWLRFVSSVPADKIPFPAEVDEVADKVFKRSLREIESEWREWASGRGVTAAATGYGPPLLPERPNDEEIEGLARLNALRKLATAPIDPNSRRTGAPPGLPLCDLDAEASMACEKHAVFLGMHEEHHKWPEAHEEDPAKEGFSPAGMRAGLRSVIVWTKGGQLDAADSIDMWIGTVYHRFPLLQYNIDRIGFAYDEGPEADVIVLDMGSLEEPRLAENENRYRWICWPPDGMKGVPRVFSFTEHPNPLEDVGLDFEDQRDTGYPVSLQLSRGAAMQLKGASLSLYVAKKVAGSFNEGDPVACWIHTPDEPLLKRMEDRSVLFAIPKEHLKSNTTFLAVARLEGLSSAPIKWTFTTGSREHGLGRR